VAGVTLDHLRKVYRGGIVAVDGLDLAVGDGDFVCVLGLSGSGKSTVLKLIAGIEDVTSGRVLIDGEDVTTRPPERRDVAMVFQSYALYPTMDVFDNIAFPLRVRKIPKADVRRRVVATADMLGIQPLLKRRPRELSGGERQRVALGRAIIREPKAFLMDEPLSNLDATLRVQMRQELKRLHSVLGATFIYVTHDQDDALMMGDRVAVLAQGRLEQYSPPAEVFDRPANRFVASFIGRMPTNLVDGVLTREDDCLMFRCPDFVLALPDQDWDSQRSEVVLGARPESIVVVPRDLDRDDLSGRVESISVLQPNVYLSVMVGSRSLAVRVPDNVDCPVVGDTVAFQVDRAKISLFDGGSGARLPMVARTPRAAVCVG
jgi:multiple sugar transport system ATP-binding protein